MVDEGILLVTALLLDVELVKNRTALKALHGIVEDEAALTLDMLVAGIRIEEAKPLIDLLDGVVEVDVVSIPVIPDSGLVE